MKEVVEKRVTYGILSYGGHVESNDTMLCSGSLPF
jgi:hypothetical protein